MKEVMELCPLHCVCEREIERKRRWWWVPRSQDRRRKLLLLCKSVFDLQLLARYPPLHCWSGVCARRGVHSLHCVHDISHTRTVEYIRVVWWGGAGVGGDTHTCARRSG
jgi:hypothetical protein